MIAKEQLPNNTLELKGIVCQLLDVVEEQRTLIANQNERIEAQMVKIEEQSQRIDQLTDQVNVLTRYKFGKKSEKVKEEKPKPSNEGGSQDGYEFMLDPADGWGIFIGGVIETPDLFGSIASHRRYPNVEEALFQSLLQVRITQDGDGCGGNALHPGVMEMISKRIEAGDAKLIGNSCTRNGGQHRNHRLGRR